MTSSDLVVAPIAAELLECLRIEVRHISKPPKKVGLRTGNEVALMIALDQDECCEGLAWVRWSGGFPSTELGAPMEVPPTAGRFNLGFWSIGFELGIARCAPTSGHRTNPTAKQWDDVSNLVFEDQAALRRAVCCWQENPRRKGNVLIASTDPIDTEGGCTGSAIQIFVRGPSCEC